MFIKIVLHNIYHSMSPSPEYIGEDSNKCQRLRGDRPLVAPYQERAISCG